MTFDKYREKGPYHHGWYRDHNWVWYKDCVDRIVDFCKGSTIDVGGGDGLVATKIIERGYKTLVIDNDDTALRILLNKDIPFEKIDLESDKLPEGEYEYLACLNVIEHLKTAEGLNNLIRNVSKGAIIITDKASTFKGRYHEHEYTKKELMETFKEFNPEFFTIKSTEFGKSITFIGVEITK